MSFLLLFSASTLVAAFFFAVRADRRTLGFVKWLSAATLLTILAGTFADVGATLYAASDAYDQSPSRASYAVLRGLAESTSPAIVGFSFLAVAAALTAVGRRRLADPS